MDENKIFDQSIKCQKCDRLLGFSPHYKQEYKCVNCNDNDFHFKRKIEAKYVDNEKCEALVNQIYANLVSEYLKKHCTFEIELDENEKSCMCIKDQNVSEKFKYIRGIALAAASVVSEMI